MSETDIFVDPTGAFVSVDGQMFYRDGFLVGSTLPEGEYVEERPMPTLWSTIVAQYRKKVTQVEAVQLTPDNVESLAQWCGGAIVQEIDPHEERTYVAINVPTLEGPIRASEDDYIIKTERGSFKTMHPAEFAQEYEVV